MNEAIVVKLAQEKLMEVKALVEKLAKAEGMLEAGYAKLAFLLDECSTNRYWEGFYESFAEFMEDIQRVYGISKSQLYNYRSAAHELNGTVSEEQFDKMGISKALLLRTVKKNTGSVPEGVLTAALDAQVTVKDLKKLVFDAKLVEQPEIGEWLDIDFSSYYTEEEKKTVLEAAAVAIHTDPKIDEKLPEHIQKKQVILKLAAEFLSTYGNL